MATQKTPGQAPVPAPAPPQDPSPFRPVNLEQAYRLAETLAQSYRDKGHYVEMKWSTES